MAAEARGGDRLLFTALWISGILRILAVVGQRPYLYVDSIDYETLDFTGGSRRPWATPLLYALIGDNRMRVVFQAIIGALCWMFLAAEVAAVARDPRVRRGALLAVLLLSLTTSITNWDNAILSESLAVSFTALLLASLLRLHRLATPAAAGAVAVAAIPWVFTRQNHLVLCLLLTGAAALVLIVRARRDRALPRPLAALVAGLAAVSVLATVSYQQNTDIVHFNVAMVIGNRVLLSPGDVLWFNEHGMPELPEGVAIGRSSNPEPLLEDEVFGAWVAEHGVRTYAEFLLAHPWWTATAPLEDFVSDRPSFADPPKIDETMLSTAESYSAARNMVPEPLEAVLFDPGQTGTLLFLLAATLAVTALRWRSGGADPRWLIPLGAIVLQWPALTVVWHASAAELGRLSLTSAVALRIGLITQIALLADAWLADREPSTG